MSNLEVKPVDSNSSGKGTFKTKFPRNKFSLLKKNSGNPKSPQKRRLSRKKKITCNTCGKQLQNYDLFSKPILQHKNLHCNLCNMDFVNVKTYTEHDESHKSCNDDQEKSSTTKKLNNVRRKGKLQSSPCLEVDLETSHNLKFLSANNLSKANQINLHNLRRGLKNSLTKISNLQNEDFDITMKNQFHEGALIIFKRFNSEEPPMPVLEREDGVQNENTTHIPRFSPSIKLRKETENTSDAQIFFKSYKSSPNKVINNEISESPTSSKPKVCQLHNSCQYNTSPLVNSYTFRRNKRKLEYDEKDCKTRRKKIILNKKPNSINKDIKKMLTNQNRINEIKARIKEAQNENHLKKRKINVQKNEGLKQKSKEKESSSDSEHIVDKENANIEEQKTTRIEDNSLTQQRTENENDEMLSSSIQETSNSNKITFCSNKNYKTKNLRNSLKKSKRKLITNQKTSLANLLNENIRKEDNVEETVLKEAAKLLPGPHWKEIDDDFGVNNVVPENISGNKSRKTLTNSNSEPKKPFRNKIYSPKNVIPMVISGEETILTTSTSASVVEPENDEENNITSSESEEKDGCQKVAEKSTDKLHFISDEQSIKISSKEKEEQIPENDEENSITSSESEENDGCQKVAEKTTDKLHFISDEQSIEISSKAKENKVQKRVEKNILIFDSKINKIEKMPGRNKESIGADQKLPKGTEDLSLNTSCNMRQIITQEVMKCSKLSKRRKTEKDTESSSLDISPNNINKKSVSTIESEKILKKPLGILKRRKTSVGFSTIQNSTKTSSLKTTSNIYDDKKQIENHRNEGSLMKPELQVSNFIEETTKLLQRDKIEENENLALEKNTNQPKRLSKRRKTLPAKMRDFNCLEFLEETLEDIEESELTFKERELNENPKEANSEGNNQNDNEIKTNYRPPLKRRKSCVKQNEGKQNKIIPKLNFSDPKEKSIKGLKYDETKYNQNEEKVSRDVEEPTGTKMETAKLLGKLTLIISGIKQKLNNISNINEESKEESANESKKKNQKHLDNVRLITRRKSTRKMSFSALEEEEEISDKSDQNVQESRNEKTAVSKMETPKSTKNGYLLRRYDWSSLKENKTINPKTDIDVSTTKTSKSEKEEEYVAAKTSTPVKRNEENCLNKTKKIQGNSTKNISKKIINEKTLVSLEKFCNLSFEELVEESKLQNLSIRKDDNVINKKSRSAQKDVAKKTLDNLKRNNVTRKVQLKKPIIRVSERIKFKSKQFDANKSDTEATKDEEISNNISNDSSSIFLDIEYLKSKEKMDMARKNLLYVKIERNEKIESTLKSEVIQLENLTAADLKKSTKAAPILHEEQETEQKDTNVIKLNGTEDEKLQDLVSNNESLEKSSTIKTIEENISVGQITKENEQNKEISSTKSKSKLEEVENNEIVFGNKHGQNENQIITESSMEVNEVASKQDEDQNLEGPSEKIVSENKHGQNENQLMMESFLTRGSSMEMNEVASKQDENLNLGGPSEKIVSRNKYGQNENQLKMESFPARESSVEMNEVASKRDEDQNLEGPSEKNVSGDKHGQNEKQVIMETFSAREISIEMNEVASKQDENLNLEGPSEKIISRNKYGQNENQLKMESFPAREISVEMNEVGSKRDEDQNLEGPSEKNVSGGKHGQNEKQVIMETFSARENSIEMNEVASKQDEDKNLEGSSEKIVSGKKHGQNENKVVMESFPTRESSMEMNEVASKQDKDQNLEGPLEKILSGNKQVQNENENQVMIESFPTIENSMEMNEAASKQDDDQNLEGPSENIKSIRIQGRRRTLFQDLREKLNKDLESDNDKIKKGKTAFIHQTQTRKTKAPSEEKAILSSKTNDLAEDKIQQATEGTEETIEGKSTENETPQIEAENIEPSKTKEIILQEKEMIRFGKSTLEISLKEPKEKFSKIEAIKPIVCTSSLVPEEKLVEKIIKTPAPILNELSATINTKTNLEIKDFGRLHGNQEFQERKLDSSSVKKLTDKLKSICKIANSGTNQVIQENLSRNNKEISTLTLKTSNLVLKRNEQVAGNQEIVTKRKEKTDSALREKSELQGKIKQKEKEDFPLIAAQLASSCGTQDAAGNPHNRKEATVSAPKCKPNHKTILLKINEPILNEKRREEASLIPKTAQNNITMKRNELVAVEKKSTDQVTDNLKEKEGKFQLISKEERIESSNSNKLTSQRILVCKPGSQENGIKKRETSSNTGKIVILLNINQSVQNQERQEQKTNEAAEEKKTKTEVKLTLKNQDEIRSTNSNPGTSNVILATENNINSLLSNTSTTSDNIEIIDLTLDSDEETSPSKTQDVIHSTNLNPGTSNVITATENNINSLQANTSTTSDNNIVITDLTLKSIEETSPSKIPNVSNNLLNSKPNNLFGKQRNSSQSKIEEDQRKSILIELKDGSRSLFQQIAQMEPKNTCKIQNSAVSNPDTLYKRRKSLGQNVGLSEDLLDTTGYEEQTTLNQNINKVPKIFIRRKSMGNSNDYEILPIDSYSKPTGSKIISLPGKLHGNEEVLKRRIEIKCRGNLISTNSHKNIPIQNPLCVVNPNNRPTQTNISKSNVLCTVQNAPIQSSLQNDFGNASSLTAQGRNFAQVGSVSTNNLQNPLHNVNIQNKNFAHGYRPYPAAQRTYDTPTSSLHYTENAQNISNVLKISHQKNLVQNSRQNNYGGGASLKPTMVQIATSKDVSKKIAGANTKEAVVQNEQQHQIRKSGFKLLKPEISLIPIGKKPDVSITNIDQSTLKLPTEITKITNSKDETTKEEKKKERHIWINDRKVKIVS